MHVSIPAKASQNCTSKHLFNTWVAAHVLMLDVVKSVVAHEHQMLKTIVTSHNAHYNKSQSSQAPYADASQCRSTIKH